MEQSTEINNSHFNKIKLKLEPHLDTLPQASHLTMLVNRFLTTLENMKVWNQIDNLIGEDRLKHQVSNIIEYTFYLRKKTVTEQEVETLTQILEGGKNND